MYSDSPYRIPISLIELAEQHNCRPVDQAHVTRLISQINGGSILPPITCRPSTKKDGYFEVVQGQHRFEAYKRLGYDEIISYIKVLSDKEVYLQSISENVVRNNLTDGDMWRISLSLYQEGLSVKEISKQLQLTDNKIRQYITFEYYLSDTIKSYHKNKKLQIGLLKYLCKVEKFNQVKLYEVMKPYRGENYDTVFNKFIVDMRCRVINNNISEISKNVSANVDTNSNEFRIRPLEIQRQIPILTTTKFSIGDTNLYLNKSQLIKLQRIIEGEEELRDLSTVINSKLR